MLLWVCQCLWVSFKKDPWMCQIWQWKCYTTNKSATSITYYGNSNVMFLVMHHSTLKYVIQNNNNALFWTLTDISPKKENPVIIYLRSCCSKIVWLVIFYGFFFLFFPFFTQVQGTNDSSVVSKVSAAAQGYFHDDFLKHFVCKVSRRAPLINR